MFILYFSQHTKSFKSRSINYISIKINILIRQRFLLTFYNSEKKMIFLFKCPTTRSIFKPGSVLTRNMTRPAPFLQLGFLLFPIIVIAQLEPFTNLDKTTKRNGIYWNLHKLPCTTWYSYPFLLDIKVTNRVACSKRSDQTLLIYNTRARRSEGQIYLRDLILVPNL